MPVLRRLDVLHGVLCLQQGAARAAIDAHLLACYVSRTNPDPLLVLPRSLTYHYHNLPNLTHYMRAGLVSGDWGSDIVRSFMAVYCLQVKKIKRSYVSTALVERTAMVNLLHGFLLGLYPYNTRHGTFDYRVFVAGSLHGIVTGDGVLAFIEQNESLFQFAMIEYLSNVVPDFCPVEEVFLLRDAQYRFNVNQVCENYRSSALSIVESGGSNVWSGLNELASSMLHALYRQLKVSNLKLNRRQDTQRVNLALVNEISNNGLFDKIMDMSYMPVTSPNMINQIKLLCPDLSFRQLQAVEYFWEIVMVSNLPKNVLEMQLDVLQKFGSCELLQRSMQSIYVCLPCALKTKGSVLNQKFAFDCIHGRMHCSACSKVVCPINLLGRVLFVKNVSYYLCCGCMQPVIWQGDLTACAACRKHEPPKCTSTCVACKRKAVEVIHKVLDLDLMQITYTPLCYTHSKSSVLSHSTVYDLKSLMMELEA